MVEQPPIIVLGGHFAVSFVHLKEVGVNVRRLGLGKRTDGYRKKMISFSLSKTKRRSIPDISL